jgi:hypothetical protein
MSQYAPGRYISIITDVDLSAVGANGIPTNLFRIVSFAASSANSTGRKCVLTTSATDANILGVLNNSPAAGEAASVAGRSSEGTFKVVVSANSSGVAVGDLLTASSDSGAITTTTSGNQLIGQALEAGVAGQVIEYLPLNHQQQS